MKILITGGAGYIGSHIVKELLEEKHQIFIYDNLVKGHRQAVSGGFFIFGDLADKNKLNQVLKKYKPKVVIHLASFIEAGESMKKPEKYFNNNVLNGLNLLEAMVENKIKFIIFSSSAAVYGQPKKIPIKENHPLKPINIYGQTKYLFEKLLEYFDKNYGLKYISLRYFNAAGADLSGKIGEDHRPETHLIPNILKVALGQKKYFEIYGDDYPTKDGTCIRDFIHVIDLAHAHILALKFLVKKKKSKVYNLGSEKGFSVKEVLEKCILITKRIIPAIIAPKRIGDPPVLIASSAKIKKELGWKPRYSDLETIIKTAWNFHQKYPKGYQK
jgi:UDP-glucose 4-epimerase